MGEYSNGQVPEVGPRLRLAAGDPLLQLAGTHHGADFHPVFWLVESIAGNKATTTRNRITGNSSSQPVGAEYIASPEFWNRTLQNWQSEFLAVGSMVVLSIYLRQRGSPESKPVGSSHSATGIEG